MTSIALSYNPRSEPDWPTPPKLHHLDGAPVRAAICEAAHFRRVPSQAAQRPAAPVTDQLDRRMWCLPGVYCLLWQPAAAEPTKVYVGSTGDLIERVMTHKQKDWSHAIMLTGHGVGIGGAQQAESAIGRVLSTQRLRHRLAPKWERHPAPWGADMPWFLFEPLVVLLNLCLLEVGVSVDLDPTAARL